MADLSSHLDRLRQLQSQLQPGQIAFLSQPSDIYYFTGVQVITLTEREAFLIISPQAAHVCVAAFTPLPAFLENMPHSKKLAVTHSLQIAGIISAIQNFVVAETTNTVLFDEKYLFVVEAKEIQAGLDTTTTNTIQYSAIDRSLIWKIRQQKDPAEIEKLKKAADIISQTLKETLSSLTLGQTERQIADQLDARMRQLGAQAPAFPTIVAFGQNAALPHHQPGNSQLTEETPVLIDCGANVDGYNSDMTRTIWFGNHPTEEFVKIEKIIKTAYQLGKDKLTQSRKSDQKLFISEIDQAVRTSIEDAGYGKFFIHTTGHGIGLEVHETPSVYLTNVDPVLENMVITLEPGIYLAGKLGYRHENTVLITSQDVQELTQ